MREERSVERHRKLESQGGKKKLKGATDVLGDSMEKQERGE